MTDKTIIQNLEKLRDIIRTHNYRYYVLNDPLVSDLEYDRLTQDLRQIEAAHPDLISPDSPTQRVGGKPLDKFKKCLPFSSRPFSESSALQIVNIVSNLEEVGDMTKLVKLLVP